MANLGGSDFRIGLVDAVHRLLMEKEGGPSIRKKAALCLLRFFRESPEDIDHQEWAERYNLVMVDDDYRQFHHINVVCVFIVG